MSQEQYFKGVNERYVNLWHLRASCDIQLYAACRLCRIYW